MIFFDPEDSQSCNSILNKTDNEEQTEIVENAVFQSVDYSLVK